MYDLLSCVSSSDVVTDSQQGSSVADRAQEYRWEHVAEVSTKLVVQIRKFVRSAEKNNFSCKFTLEPTSSQKQTVFLCAPSPKLALVKKVLFHGCVLVSCACFCSSIEAD